MYDPLMTYLPGISKSSAPGMSMNFTKDGKETVSIYKDQFKPLNVFGCEIMKGEYFNGTLFRFPIRKSQSEISSNIYSREDIFDLIEKFTKEAVDFLLFLKHLKDIEILHIDAQGNKKTLYSCKVEEIGEKRKDNIIKILKGNYNGDLNFIYQLRFTETIKGNQQKQDWIFSNILDKEKIQKISEKINSEGKFLAFGQIAYRLDKIITGKPYCFLRNFHLINFSIFL